MTTSRNAPCPCESGKKFKQCCGAPGSRSVRRNTRTRNIIIAVFICIIVGVALGFLVSKTIGEVVGILGFFIVMGWALFGKPPGSRGGGDPGAIRYGR